MTTDSLAEIEEIVCEALEIDTEKRGGWLNEHCPPVLREEVESLLSFEFPVEKFLATPAFAKADFLLEEKDEKLKFEQLGAYKIIREIAHGGMGLVYLAVRNDDEYKKQVAIKVIRRGMDTEDIIRRFRYERQILAELEHPNIARLLDGGSTDDGLPYLVMEYVEGSPLTKFCNTKNLSVSERLKIFLKVCNAVSYAHQHLVVHRDLKPSNIFVTNEGDVKLLDFGIAKLLDDSTDATQTNTNLRAFTPDYASPEQIRGAKVTTASDVYSLGVLLYELLTRKLPYQMQNKTFDEISKAILTQNPSRPSSIRTENDPQSKIQNLKLNNDLDNITLMALRKEPSRRYASVQQFAEDIERYLNQ